MNGSLLHHAFGVRKGYDYVRTVYGGGCIRFVLAARQELLVCPRCHSAQVKRKGRRFRELQTGAHRLEARVAGDGGAPVRVSGVRPELRGFPPFAPPYVWYT